MEKLSYILNSGKNFKFKYYFINYLRLITPPKWLLRWRLESTLKQCEKRSDALYIKQRVEYYNKLDETMAVHRKEWQRQMIPLKEQKMCSQKVYYFDTFQYTRWFPQHLLWRLLPGDITFVPPVPSIVKSRPLTGNNAYSVLMKLDKVRHFIFVKDRKRFTDKKDKVIFRGKIGKPGTGGYKENRYRFLTMYWGHPMCDLGEINGHHANPEWLTGKMTIRRHLDYKFILSLEGNDVASNLKWVMSSNSLAVMPRPTCETWFMEGTLIPNYHYVEIKPDYSDLEERLNYYIDHPDEAQQIIDHAHEYVNQFRDSKREKLISLLVLGKYFRLTNDELG